MLFQYRAAIKSTKLHLRRSVNVTLAREEVLLIMIHADRVLVQHGFDKLVRRLYANIASN